MRNVFVDTWAWYALSSRYDADHQTARAAISNLQMSGTRLITSHYVTAEATTLLRYRRNHPEAVAFRKLIRQLVLDNVLVVARISESQENAAGEIFERYREMDLSFTDCTSFALMRDMEITEEFTGDHHFEAMGFSILP
mgnify:CR=1 FL=1